MAKVTAEQAAEIVSVSHWTVVRWVNEQLLPAERRTLKRIIRIDIDDLRRFAHKNGYDFDEVIAGKY